MELGLPRWKPVKLAGLNAADISELFKLLARPDLADDETLLVSLVKETAGEPFYLRFLAEELASGAGPVNIPRDLPKDSQLYIARQVHGLQGSSEVNAAIGDTLKTNANYFWCYNTHRRMRQGAQVKEKGATRSRRSGPALVDAVQATVPMQILVRPREAL